MEKHDSVYVEKKIYYLIHNERLPNTRNLKRRKVLEKKTIGK